MTHDEVVDEDEDDVVVVALAVVVVAFSVVVVAFTVVVVRAVR